jgi:hypothetical protein
MAKQPPRTRRERLLRALGGNSAKFMSWRRPASATQRRGEAVTLFRGCIISGALGVPCACFGPVETGAREKQGRAVGTLLISFDSFSKPVTAPVWASSHAGSAPSLFFSGLEKMPVFPAPSRARWGVESVDWFRPSRARVGCSDCSDGPAPPESPWCPQSPPPSDA